MPPYFSAIFSKGNNLGDFLFASLYNMALLKLRSTLKGKNLLLMEQILFSELIPIKQGGKNVK